MSIKSLILTNRREIIQIARTYGAKNIRLFGSVQTEQDNPDSDIDFLIDLENDRSLLDIGGLAYDLEQLLGKRVDVVTEKGLHWFIKEAVLREAEPL